jgi:protein-S-isoprenylcysteine O-methyltransferase Ste14
MIFFGVLKIGTLEFIMGTILYLAGLGLLVLGIINYRDVPLNEPITKGIYKYSRNPQMLALYIMCAGMVLVIGSWFNLILLGVSITCSHFSILGEEHSLAQQYGDSYLEYKKQIARYFLFF